MDDDAPLLDLDLTPLERAAAPLLVEGLTGPQIAPRIGCSQTTIATVMPSLYRKLGAATRAEAVAAVIRHGLADPA